MDLFSPRALALLVVLWGLFFISYMSETLFFTLVLILIVAAVSVTLILKFLGWFHRLIDYLERH